jgi:hypothetical protein
MTSRMICFALALAMSWVPSALADPFDDWERKQNMEKLLQLEQERNDLLRRQTNQQQLQMIYQMQASNAEKWRQLNAMLAQLNRRRATLRLAPCYVAVERDEFGFTVPGDLVCPEDKK